ncbi:SGNH/GDSL hydrolase family protein [Gordonia sp. SID5947]|uniref:SGNH/GDSL hydrolase family protein n=1 Tax=Gordonia sp. SID5947 TaxID=2690315 RepID=UPI0013698EF7|nr:SGNH/GDSL hydrolase family protein [Gordonia sp. SID5947]MYR06963.1 SGNH/GDSL hydrolase family protein [Gordonia sp. SID5947]
MRRELVTRAATIAASVAAVAAVVVPGTAITETVSPPVTANAAGSGHTPKTYVALGSSYAAGPELSSTPRTPCMRSTDNYPHRVAEARGLRLVDVTCSGATTFDIVDRAQRGKTSEPQIAAVTPKTALVTITTGGNDLRYIGRLTAQSCGNAVQPAAAAMAERVCGGGRLPSPEPAPAAYREVERTIARTVEAIRARAPRARIVLVDYPPVIGDAATSCAGLPLTYAERVQTKRVFDGLAQATARAARSTGAVLVTASKAGAAHAVCSQHPWVYGFERGIFYHPNSAGKAAQARLILRALQ